MAGSFADGLVDAFSDDEVVGGQDEGPVLESNPLVDAEDFMRRAVQMLGSPGKPEDEADEAAGPEQKADYYRRMVQMSDVVRNNGYAGGGIVEAVLSSDMIDGGKGIGLQVTCSEFQKSGGCRSGMYCKFVHDGAFRAAGSKVPDLVGPGDDVTVDPEDFIRRALQLRSLQQKNNKAAPGRPAVPGQEHRVPYW